MSCWLSMSATFKIDCGSEERYLQFKKDADHLIGKWVPDDLCWPKEGQNEEAIRLFQELCENPYDAVPLGSEGTAQVEIGELHVGSFEEPDYFMVTVTGNLRDVESFNGLKNWFTRSCLNLKGIRRLNWATCSGKLSWFGETLFMRFDDSGIKTILLEEEDEDDWDVE